MVKVTHHHSKGHTVKHRVLATNSGKKPDIEPGPNALNQQKL